MARPRPGDGLAGGRGSQHRCLLTQRPDRNLPGHRPCGVVRLDLPVELPRVESMHLRPVVPALGVVEAVGVANHVPIAPVPDQLPDRRRVSLVGAHA